MRGKRIYNLQKWYDIYAISIIERFNQLNNNGNVTSFAFYIRFNFFIIIESILDIVKSYICAIVPEFN